MGTVTMACKVTFEGFSLCCLLKFKCSSFYSSMRTSDVQKIHKEQSESLLGSGSSEIPPDGITSSVRDGWNLGQRLTAHFPACACVVIAYGRRQSFRPSPCRVQPDSPRPAVHAASKSLGPLSTCPSHLSRKDKLLQRRGSTRSSQDPKRMHVIILEDVAVASTGSSRGFLFSL